MNLIKRFWSYITLTPRKEVKPAIPGLAFITRVDRVGHAPYYRVETINYSNVYASLERAREVRDIINSTNIPFITETTVE